MPAWSPWTVCAAVAWAGVCVVVTAVAIASTTAPPIWNELPTRPEASPCSSSATPRSAWMLSAGYASAKPAPASASDATSTA